MAALSDYAEDALLDHLLSVSSYTPAATLYLALFTSSAGLENNTEGSQTEVSGGSYARKAVTFNAASGGATANTAAVEFDEATGDWGTLTHVAVMDALTSGNVLCWGALTSSKAIETGDQFKFSAGNLDITLA